jgi:hypothetical protein
MRTHTSQVRAVCINVEQHRTHFPFGPLPESPATACLVESFLEAVRRNTSAATPPFGVHREAFAQAGLIIQYYSDIGFDSMPRRRPWWQWGRRMARSVPPATRGLRSCGMNRRHDRSEPDACAVRSATKMLGAGQIRRLGGVEHCASTCR